MRFRPPATNSIDWQNVLRTRRDRDHEIRPRPTTDRVSAAPRPFGKRKTGVCGQFNLGSYPSRAPSQHLLQQMKERQHQ